jgi:hypothetical protein
LVDHRDSGSLRGAHAAEADGVAIDHQLAFVRLQ